MSHLFELFPVVLAILVLFQCNSAYLNARRSSDRFIIILVSICSGLLIIAQLSWWSASILQGKLEDTWFANQIWTVFNSITMLVFLLMLKRPK